MPEFTYTAEDQVVQDYKVGFPELSDEEAVNACNQIRANMLRKPDPKNINLGRVARIPTEIAQVRKVVAAIRQEVNSL
jgi:hypothetical protein